MAVVYFILRLTNTHTNVVSQSEKKASLSSSVKLPHGDRMEGNDGSCNMHADADADAGTYYYVQAIVESESKVRLAHTYVVVLMLPLLQHKE